MRGLVAVAITTCALLLGAASGAAQFPQPGRRAPAWPPRAPHYPSAKTSVDIGNFYLRRKDYRGALSRFKEAMKTDPYYAPAYLGLGKAYDKMGFKPEALADYQKYLDNLDSEKQADRARGVHRAINRLKHEIAEEQAANAKNGWKPKPAPQVH
ncbi:MAG: tetratricopeptide repeat protein [Terriglobia bacterium]